MSDRGPIFVGTVADGATDHRVMFSLIKAVESRNFETDPSIDLTFSDPTHLELSQSLVNPVARLRKAINGPETLNFENTNIEAFIRETLTILLRADAEMRAEANRPLTSNDYLVVNTDIELFFPDPDSYFRSWAQTIGKTILLATERYYHTLIQRGFHYNIIPTMLPLPLFPSTDILIAAARLNVGENFHFNGRKASDLKQILYGTSDLRHLRPEQFEEQALDFLTHDRLHSIYTHVPEARLFLRHICQGVGLPPG